MKKPLPFAWMLTGFCIVMALLALNACSTVGKVLNIENPRYSFRNIRPNVSIALPLSASTIDLDFTLGVDNPNDVGIRLDRVDLDLLINDETVMRSFSRDQRITIPANGYGDVRLSMRLGYNDVRSLWREVTEVVQGNRARYELRGNAYYNTPLGAMKFPVTVYSTDDRRPQQR